MLKKKQTIMVVTIALASFLMGTMFGAVTLATGGNPFDAIWEAIFDLDERLKALEEQIPPPTITVIGPWSGGEMDAFLPVLQAFEEKTGIDVEYKIYRAEDLATLLPAEFAAGTTPGDVIFMWSWFIQEKGQEGHILDVTDLINEADFSPGVLDPAKVGDTLYGGAYTGKVKPGFWYRKSFFDANGLSEPTTWSEFTALLDDIAAVPGIVNPIVSGDAVGWPLSDVTEHFLATFGGPDLHRDLTAGTVAWTSTEVKTIFQDKLVPLLQGNFSAPMEWTVALEAWWAEEYGLYFMGSWITGMVDDPDDLGVFALPGAEGLVFGADYFFIPAYTEHPEEAKELFQFLASDEAQEIQVAQGGHIATNVNVPLDAYPPVDREVAEVMTGKEVLTDLDDTIGGEFQTTFWDQLKLLWVQPGQLDNVLTAIQAVSPRNLTGEISIGALLSMTGDLATFGENHKVAAEFAVEEVNAFLQASGADWTMKLVVEDTQVDPSIALSKVESLAARGIKLLLGPLSSGEVRAIKAYADANKILVISQSSTAPDLAIADDYIFRFVPSDRLGQGPAIGRIMYDDGKRYVIPVWRNDAWGFGLEEAVKTRFEELGGTFLQGIGYVPEATEFSTEAATLASKVASAVATYGADQVAVLHISFEGVNAFFTEADDYAVLSTVKWYGSDGTAVSGAMLEDQAVIDFAIDVSYPCTLFAPTVSDKFEMVRQHGFDVLGRELDVYAYNVYDIVWVYALSLLEVDAYDSEAVKAVLPTVTQNYFGASGWIVLDENGDRMAGDYDIWQIKETSPGVFGWEKTGKYILATDSVEWFP